MSESNQGTCKCCHLEIYRIGESWHLKSATEHQGQGAVPCKGLDYAGGHEPAEPSPAEPFSKGYKHRNGKPVSDACGDGKHSECTQHFTKCHCTVRGGHNTMHAYLNAPIPPVSASSAVAAAKESIAMYTPETPVSASSGQEPKRSKKCSV
jgi:hypothetical protein